ncbi:MAG: SHOCT-like domain-containing protein [Lachnospirales bacterium]
MEKERMMILELLEEGKITPEEALNLISALNVNREEDAKENKKYTEEKEEDNDDSSEEDTYKNNFDADMENFKKSVESFAEEVNGKFNEFASDVEPKVRRATKKFLKNTSKVFRMMAESLDD